MPRNGATLSTLAGVMTIALLGACGSAQKDGESAPPPSEETVNEEGWQTPPPEQGSEPTAQPGQAPAPEQEADPIGGGATAEGGVSDAEVEAFARAYLEVVAIQQDFQVKLQGAGSQQEAEQLQVEAQNEVQQAIEDEGMSPEDFDELGQKVEQDEELRQRVELELQELQSGAAPGQEGMQ